MAKNAIAIKVGVRKMESVKSPGYGKYYVDYVDERTIRLTIELSKKIPEATYIQELVENNIRRPKKAKVH